VVRIWPLETSRPLEAAPAGECASCGCRLSQYRAESETRCWPCQAATTVAPTPLVVAGRSGVERVPDTL
jgi:hypothetical protein